MSYLDANIFLYAILYEDEKANACKRLITEIIGGKKEGSTSILSWDEIVFIVHKNLGKDNAAREGRKFLELPNLVFIKADEKIIQQAQKLIEKYNLKPRDAIHAASALTNNIKEIISDDPDFDKIKELKRISPGNFSKTTK